MTTTAAAMPQTDNPQVFRALEEYTAALEAGRTPCREEILARYPAAAAVLPECLEGNGDFREHTNQPFFTAALGTNR